MAIEGLIVLDTNQTNAEESRKIVRDLYHGVSGYLKLDENILNDSIIRMNHINNLILQENILIIEEVRKENNHRMMILNDHIGYLRNMKKCPNKDYRKLHKDHCKIDELEEFRNDGQNIENIIRLADEINRFMHLSRGKDPRERFNERQKEIYDFILERAHSYSKDLDMESENSRRDLKHHTPIGSSLHTDQHLAAVSYTLAYINNKPVTLMTYDKGLITLIERMRQNIPKTSIGRKMEQSNGFSSRVYTDSIK